MGFLKRGANISQTNHEQLVRLFGSDESSLAYRLAEDAFLLGETHKGIVGGHIEPVSVGAGWTGILTLSALSAQKRIAIVEDLGLLRHGIDPASDFRAAEAQFATVVLSNFDQVFSVGAGIADALRAEGRPEIIEFALRSELRALAADEFPLLSFHVDAGVGSSWRFYFEMIERLLAIERSATMPPVKVEVPESMLVGGSPVEHIAAANSIAVKAFDPTASSCRFRIKGGTLPAPADADTEDFLTFTCLDSQRGILWSEWLGEVLVTDLLDPTKAGLLWTTAREAILERRAVAISALQTGGVAEGTFPPDTPLPPMPQRIGPLDRLAVVIERVQLQPSAPGARDALADQLDNLGLSNLAHSNRIVRSWLVGDSYEHEAPLPSVWRADAYVAQSNAKNLAQSFAGFDMAEFAKRERGRHVSDVVLDAAGCWETLDGNEFWLVGSSINLTLDRPKPTSRFVLTIRGRTGFSGAAPTSATWFGLQGLATVEVVGGSWSVETTIDPATTTFDEWIGLTLHLDSSSLADIFLDDIVIDDIVIDE